MYTYIYDSFVTGKKHERLLARIETRLTDLGISGRIERLTMFKNIREIAVDAGGRGCETMVAVGNDETVGRLIDAVGDFDMAFGIIPIGDGPHVIAEMLGIVPGVEACNILSRRVLQTIDLGKVNDHYFLSSVRIPRTRAAISCNGQYEVIPTEDNEIQVCNLAALAVGESGEMTVSSPHDGYLETVFRPAPSRNIFSRLWRTRQENVVPTVVPVRFLSMRNQTPVTVIRDGQRLSSSSLKIEIVPKKLKVITGRERKFE